MNPVIVVNEDGIVKQVFQTNSNEHAQQLFEEMIKGFEWDSPSNDFIEEAIMDGYHIVAKDDITIFLVHPVKAENIDEVFEILQ